jgi:orotidine-5'-phosphate decarboxylase
MKPLIVALDVETDVEALALVQKLKPHVDVFKVGPVLFLKYGGDLLQKIRDQGAQIFLDLKFHDIPSVVKKAIERASEWGIYSATIHASGGLSMMREAASAQRRPKLWGVTVLTSFDQSDLQGIGVQKPVDAQVEALAALAKEAGLDGVIASVQEAVRLKQTLGRGFQVVTPGIRFEKGGDDQKRTQTPAQAMEAGVDFFVMGRPVTAAPDPVAVIRQIYQSINVPI